MFKPKLRLARLITSFSLRAKRRRKPLDLRSIASQVGLQVSSALDIGSGPKPRNPFGANCLFGVDIRSYDINPNVKKCVLGVECIPFEENVFDVVTAYVF